jgi:hypothetical protein
MTMTQQIHRDKHKKKQKHLKPVPQEFIEDCKVLAVDFEKNRPKVAKIYDKWKAKHESVKDITRWLRTQLKQWYSPNGITQMIPENMRRKYEKTGKYVGFTKNGKNVPAAERPPQLSLSDNYVARKAPTTIPQQATKMGSTRKEPTHTHRQEVQGIFNQGADEYEIDELEQYDIDYLRIIIRWLHQLRMDFIKEAFKWQTKFDTMQKEKKELLAKLEAHGIK